MVAPVTAKVPPTFVLPEASRVVVLTPPFAANAPVNVVAPVTAKVPPTEAFFCTCKLPPLVKAASGDCETTKSPQSSAGPVDDITSALRWVPPAEAPIRAMPPPLLIKVALSVEISLELELNCEVVIPPSADKAPFRVVAPVTAKVPPTLASVRVVAPVTANVPTLASLSVATPFVFKVSVSIPPVFVIPLVVVTPVTANVPGTRTAALLAPNTI